MIMKTPHPTTPAPKPPLSAPQPLHARLNKRERRAQRLLSHYAVCERLALALEMDPNEIDGKKISSALFKLEKLANAGATAWCNGEIFSHRYGFGNAHTSGTAMLNFNFPGDEHAWDKFTDYINTRLCQVFGRSHKYPPTGFFVNGDCRGYALKIDNENPEGAKLIEAVGLHRDMGGFGVLSPSIEEEE